MIADTSWMAGGKCREHSPKVFFPTDGVGVEIARRICASCPVREPCLEYAVDNRIEHGVWGGTSERGRRRLARARPLLHAKLLVLGNLVEHHFDTPVGEYSEWRFEESRVWIGSANWTNLTANHLDVGLWIDDPQLVTHATEFVSDLISFSEPFGSTAIVPTPELQDYEPDPDMWLDAYDDNDT